MDRIFKSKVDGWYHLLLFILIILCLLTVVNGNVWAIVVTLLVSALAVHALLSTYYIVADTGKLILHCSIFPRKEIEISRIEALERSVLPVWSYALSLNRIVIWSEGKMWMMVSPQNEKDFIRLLRSFNPDIKLKQETNDDV
ncbi:MAG: PH domain-containing protein [Tannerellaceae bacterium]|jgi:hypothetical protein|nr:PH domain-containing protein [Tannerellaceae bacterium]